MVTLRMRPKPTHSTREHIEVVEKIRAGDAGPLSKHIGRIATGARELLAILEQYRLKTL